MAIRSANVSKPCSKRVRFADKIVEDSPINKSRSPEVKQTVKIGDFVLNLPSTSDQITKRLASGGILKESSPFDDGNCSVFSQEVYLNDQNWGLFQFVSSESLNLTILLKFVLKKVLEVF
jgi:hypothetical protein